MKFVTTSLQVPSDGRQSDSALSIARGQGVQESLLFTQNPLAERAYQAIGYRRVADYYLALFHEGVRLGDVR